MCKTENAVLYIMLTTTKQPYNSVLVKASSQRELSLSFMRFQEYYENPCFKNKIFTCGQLKEWYSIRYGSDSYIRDWSGFNIPSVALIPFRNGLFDPLTKQEQNLLNLFRYRNDIFYIIGAQDDSVLRHELSHAMYFTNLNYRTKINQYLTKHEKSLSKSFHYLLNKGYHQDVINDELQAYITDNDDEFIIENTPQRIIKYINQLYNRYAKNK